MLLEISLPLTNPVLKFLLILLIILLAPLLLNRVKIPHLLGLILAGAIVGPNGLGLMERDSGIIMSGTAGLLYIMFLAGLEIDLLDFKKNSRRSLVFGMYTFIIPMSIGTVVGLYVLNFSVLTSVLLASMFASHTLIAYPIISKLGVVKNRAVSVAVGGTMITDTLALLVLAVIVGMTRGEVNTAFWLRLSLSVLGFGLIVVFVFPLIGRWFLKHFEDNVSQYIFVLAMVFLGASLAELAGIEAIIGAFLTGLALNRLIPHTSPLMNRIEFVGNAIFIPFFLLGVGMLVDYRAFIKDWETVWVAFVMTVVATVAKFLAAWLTQQTYAYTADERRLIFGLSNAQAAATLAAVLVGYNIILGETAAGEPIRLLSESVLNGTIIMILITCTLASFQAQKGAKNIALLETTSATAGEVYDYQEKILIPLRNISTAEELVNLSITLRSKQKQSELYALSIIDSDSHDDAEEKRARRVMDKARATAAATDTQLHELIRYDLNIVNGISGIVREHRITDLIMGLHHKKGISDTFLGTLAEGILTRCNTTTLIYKPAQPLATIKRHLVLVPEKAEREIGFPYWLSRLWNLARNTGARLVFYGHPATLAYIREVQAQHAIECHFVDFTDWDDFLILARDIRIDDNLILVLSRRDRLSYHGKMDKVPTYLNQYFQANSFILIFPMQSGVEEHEALALMNPSFLESIERLDEIGKTIAGLFRRH